MTGEDLDVNHVREAREEESGKFREHKSRTKVCQERHAGTKHRKHQSKVNGWMDRNKGDKIHPELKSSCVAKDSNMNIIESVGDHFLATGAGWFDYQAFRNVSLKPKCEVLRGNKNGRFGG